MPPSLSRLVAARCLATDLSMGFPLEHGQHSTLVALRVADRLGVDDRTVFETYYGCLLFYAGCTADAEIAAAMFDEGAMLEYFTPVVFGSPAQTLAGVVRALAGPAGTPLSRRRRRRCGCRRPGGDTRNTSVRCARWRRC